MTPLAGAGASAVPNGQKLKLTFHANGAGAGAAGEGGEEYANGGSGRASDDD